MQDPAGIFPSHAHRQVLAHLSTPDDDYVWSLQALHQRMRTSLTLDDIDRILNELVLSGDVDNMHVGYRMSPTGFARLTGPVADEPPPGAEPVGPAVIRIGAEVEPAPTPLPKVEKKRRFRRRG